LPGGPVKKELMNDRRKFQGWNMIKNSVVIIICLSFLSMQIFSEDSNNDYFNNQLLQAVISNHINIVEDLIYKGADVNTKDNNGNTPIFLAVSSYNNNLELEKLLIKKGADLNIKNDDGLNPLLYLIKSKSETSFYIFDHDIEIIKELLNNNIDPTAIDSDGRTVLHLIVSHLNSVDDIDFDLPCPYYSNYREVLDLLIEKGSKYNQPDYYGETVLDITKKLFLFNLQKYLSALNEDIFYKKATVLVKLDPEIEGNIIINNSIHGKTNQTITIYPGSFRLIFENNNYISQKYITIKENENLIISNLILIQKNKYLIKESESFNKKTEGYTIWAFYLAGAIFPLTNLLYTPYYDAYTFSMLMEGINYIFLPCLVVSLTSMAASISTISAGGYKYFLELNNNTYKALFISSIVCGSISYLINLIYGIFISHYIFYDFNKRIKEIKQKNKKDILDNMILDFSFNPYQNTTSLIVGLRL
jgi:ankyrin repeat protein